MVRKTSTLKYPITAACFAFALGSSGPLAAQDNSNTQAKSDTKTEGQQQAGAKPASKDMPEIIALSVWDYDSLYPNTWSVRQLMDNATVYGPGGDDIGSIENFVIGRDGKIAGIIAEVGGIWDIGDTHVFVPIDKVSFGKDYRVGIPVTEDTVGDYSTWADNYLTKSGTKTVQQVDDDVKTGYRLWKATEIIGDDAFTSDKNGFGSVSDVLFQDGKVTGLVLTSYAGYGGGYRAVPFHGYRYGWSPGNARYTVLYSSDALKDLALFDYGKMKNKPDDTAEAENLENAAKSDNSQ